MKEGYYSKFNFGNDRVNESVNQLGDKTLSDDDSACVRDVLVVKNNSKLIQAAGTIIVPIKINGKSINAVLDTATQVSVLNNMFVTQNWPDIQFSGDVSLQGIGNNSVQSHLWENVNITLGNMDYPWHVFVAPIHDTCTLGLDFIMQYEIDISMSSNGLFIKGEKIPFQIQGKNKSIPLNIRTVQLHQNVMIPAYTCVLIPLQIKSQHFDKNDLVSDTYESRRQFRDADEEAYASRWNYRDRVPFEHELVCNKRDVIIH